MDEYRPYPAEQPDDATSPEHEAETEVEPTKEPVHAGPSSQVADDTEEADEHADEHDEAEGADDESPREGGRQHPERQAPDLEHPGGHLHGVVARVNRPRRFGFLRSDDGVEVFFHASALDAGPNAFDALRPGQEMEWDCHQDEGGRGLAATTVTVLGEPPERPARPPRPERPDRPERPERQGRGEPLDRGGRQRGGQRGAWRVTVLTDRGDQSVAQQLERLLNDRGVKPGNFTFNLTETDEGVECWVATFNG